MAVIGWLCVALAALIFFGALVGFVSPKAFQGPNDSQPVSRWKYLLAAWLGPVVPGAIGLALLPTPAPDQAFPAVTASAPAVTASAVVSPSDKSHFGITPDQFRSAYNKALNANAGAPNLISGLELEPLQIEKGKTSDSFRQTIESANTYLLGSTSKQTGYIDSLMIGIGGGDASTMLRALMVTTLAVRSATGIHDLGSAVTDVLGDAGDQMKDPNKTPQARSIGDYKLNAVGLRDVGILATLSREKL